MSSRMRWSSHPLSLAMHNRWRKARSGSALRTSENTQQASKSGILNQVCEYSEQAIIVYYLYFTLVWLLSRNVSAFEGRTRLADSISPSDIVTFNQIARLSFFFLIPSFSNSKISRNGVVSVILSLQWHCSFNGPGKVKSRNYQY